MFWFGVFLKSENYAKMSILFFDKEVCSFWKLTWIETPNKVDSSYVYFSNRINISSLHAQMNSLFQPNLAVIKNLFEKKFSQNSVLQAKIQIFFVWKVKAGSKCFFVSSLVFFERIYVIQTKFHSFPCQTFFQSSSSQEPSFAQTKHSFVQGRNLG